MNRPAVVVGVLLTTLAWGRGEPAAPAASPQAVAAQPAKAAAVYDESADATKDVAAAVKRAARENKRVLLDVGGNWCGWCRLLHDLFTQDAEVRSLLRAEY